MKSNKYRVRKKMDKRMGAIVTLCVALVLTLCAGYLGLNGTWLDSRGLYKLLPWLPTADVENWPQPISLGLDLKGGVYVEYEATMSDELKEAGYDFNTLLDSTMGVIQKRLTEKGYPEATVSQLGTSGIRVEIPAVTDPAAVLNLIGSPAKLEFLDPQGNVFMEGRHLQAATPTVDESYQPAISFTLTKEGAQLFGDTTAASVGQTITIQLDGQELMSPTVNEAIYGGQVLVTGDFTAEDAENICLQLQSGALPLDLRQDKLDTISATLGIDALSTSVTAAVIGILIVMIIMAVRYRLAGVVADWALMVYIIVLFLLLAVVPGIQLTLPGIAGIILGIGMAVDANVVIFERVKEEVHEGRPMIHAVRIGFKNALSAVIDANVTTIIAAVVLLFFGTGSVQGFAITLLLGVVTSMLSAIVVTRFLLTRFVRVWPGSKLYVSQKAGQSKLKIVNRSRVCAIVSAGIMVVALVLSFCGLGVNYGLDFAGGLNIQYNMGAAFEQSDIEEALKAQGVNEYSISTSGEQGHTVQIRVPKLSGDDEIQNLQNGLEEALIAKYPTMDTANATASYVGPVAGKVLVQNAIWSVVLAAALMLVYIAIRFDLASGMAAVVGLLHDVLIMLAAMVLLRSVIQMNSSFIAAMLTIVGYSINNTIVIFDRIRENNKKPVYAGLRREEVVNVSVRESFGRTINTTLTTLVTIVALYVLGVSSIREFSLPIIVGIVAGVYSANLINGYVWALLEEKLGKRKAKKA